MPSTTEVRLPARVIWLGWASLAAAAAAGLACAFVPSVAWQSSTGSGTRTLWERAGWSALVPLGVAVVLATGIVVAARAQSRGIVLPAAAMAALVLLSLSSVGLVFLPAVACGLAAAVATFWPRRSGEGHRK